MDTNQGKEPVRKSRIRLGTQEEATRLNNCGVPDRVKKVREEVGAFTE
jgi:hypothetical protein